METHKKYVKICNATLYFSVLFNLKRKQNISKFSKALIGNTQKVLKKILLELVLGVQVKFLCRHVLHLIMILYSFLNDDFFDFAPEDVLCLSQIASICSYTTINVIIRIT